MFYWEKVETPEKVSERADTAIIKEPRIIESINNRIYFYSEVTRSNVLQLVRSLKSLDGENVTRKIIKGLDYYDPIYLHVNSYGGSLFAGLSALDNIVSCKSPIKTIVDGITASAGTFLTIVGNTRYMTKHSTMLIHQLSSFFWGKYHEFEDEKKNLDLLMDILKTVYNKYSKVPSKEIDKILKHDLLFDTKKCIKYGLVDEII